ncbi:MAG: 50S ribosomal protein L21, partial [Dehalococcoidia bacterium]|nr:50S ribosomal protein L21 [Dehalococcoidia bacterium]
MCIRDRYKVTPGQKVRVDLLGVPPGSRVELDRVLFISDEGKALIGRPLIEGARVIAACTGEGKAPKVIAFKYHSKNRYRRKIGHRQPYTELTIQHILRPGETEPAAPVTTGTEAITEKTPETTTPAAEEAKTVRPRPGARKKAAPATEEAPAAEKTEKKAARPRAQVRKTGTEASGTKTTRRKTVPETEEK